MFQTVVKDNKVVILLQDKGSMIVLEDSKLHKDIQKKITKKLKTLQDDGKLSFQQYMELKPQSKTIPRIYGLPNAHKKPSDPLYRPIVDYTGSST